MDREGVPLKSHAHHPARAGRPPLGQASILLAATFAVELATGLLTNSVSLLADAAHVFTDLAAMLFSFLAYRLADRPASDRRTFGLHRLEVMAAFLNGALVAALALWVLVESLRRLGAPPEVRTGPMLAVALTGLAANLLIAWRLHAFVKDDVNVRGAFLHVAGDALSSVGVVAAALLIRWTGNPVFDPAAAILVAIIIILSAARLLRESVHILLEGVPRGMDMDRVREAMTSVPGVLAVEDMHVWNICSRMCFLSAHVVLPPEKMHEQEAVLANLRRALREGFHIDHVTIQIESSAWTRDDRPHG